MPATPFHATRPTHPMKSTLVGLLLFSLALSAVAAPSDEVIAAEKARGRALLAGDATALAAVLADDLVYIHSTGKHESKAEVLAGISSKKVAYERFDLSQTEVRLVTPEVAVLSGTIDQRKLGGGKWADLKLLFHSVWRREAGTWRQVSLQTVQPPAPRP
ncbi:MAG: nuclear transport factor 2 family protein [Opitutaceae bacterium]